MVIFSSKISPRTSTVIFLERSPFATAVVTSAMLRTWPVRLFAIEFTESVRSFHVPETPFTCAWPPSFPSPYFARYTSNLRGKSVELIDHCVDRVFQFKNLPAYVDGDLFGEVARCDGG